MDYVILTGKTKFELEKYVINHLVKGYELVGGVSYGYKGTFCQAMIKKEA